MAYWDNHYTDYRRINTYKRSLSTNIKLHEGKERTDEH